MILLLFIEHSLLKLLLILVWCSLLDISIMQ